MQYYIDCRLVSAVEEENDSAQAGYCVVDQRERHSWIAEAEFEENALPMGGLFQAAYGQANAVLNDSTVTPEMVENFIAKIECRQLDEKTTYVKATLVNGYVIHETSCCVDPANYSQKIGKLNCLSRIRDKVWELLGFLLETARCGVRHVPLERD